jgi:hypothetical protein
MSHLHRKLRKYTHGVTSVKLPKNYQDLLYVLIVRRAVSLPPLQQISRELRANAIRNAHVSEYNLVLATIGFISCSKYVVYFGIKILMKIRTDLKFLHAKTTV